jgi:hypothetical protein
MRVAGEIYFDTRTVLEHLLSPVTEAYHEAGRQRQISRRQSGHPLAGRLGSAAGADVFRNRTFVLAVLNIRNCKVSVAAVAD